MSATGRFAPSPSGDLHIGNLRTALLAWLFARSTGRAFLIRMEDLDRVRPGAAERQLEDLSALGLDWDGDPIRQTGRRALYDSAIDRLVAAGRTFECFCTRREILEAPSAPHRPPGAYPGTCRELSEAERARKRAERAPAIRLRTDVETWTVQDLLHGEITADVDDFVLRRGDGVPAYNLAVVVDDGEQGADGLSPRSTHRGRPRATSTREDPCARCGRNIPRLAARWPEGRLCFTCYNTAIHTHGTCPNCGQDRLLPGPPGADGEPVCGTCAGIDVDFHCQHCGVEAGHHRGNLCARCVLREDLHTLLGGTPSDPTLAGLVDALCAAYRPESIITWKRSPKVQTLLAGLGDGSIPCTHDGLDTVGGRPAEHLRALLQHHDLLPPRDPYLPRFELWIAAKLDDLPDEVRQPVHHFATWHHLRRIRDKSAAGTPTRAPIHSAKQEITETIKFLTWLHTTYGRTAATCTQPDIDECSPPDRRPEPRSEPSSSSPHALASTPPSPLGTVPPATARR